MLCTLYLVLGSRCMILAPRAAKTCGPFGPVGANFCCPVLIFGQRSEKLASNTLLEAPLLEASGASGTGANSPGARSSSA